VHGIGSNKLSASRQGRNGYGEEGLGRGAGVWWSRKGWGFYLATNSGINVQSFCCQILKHRYIIVKKSKLEKLSSKLLVGEKDVRGSFLLT